MHPNWYHRDTTLGRVASLCSAGFPIGPELVQDMLWESKPKNCRMLAHFTTVHSNPRAYLFAKYGYILWI